MAQNDGTTSNIDTAKAGIAAAAEGTPGTVAAPAESGTSAAPATTVVENAFASEDAELAKLEAEAKAAEEAKGKAAEKGSTTDGTSAGTGTAAPAAAGAKASATAAAAAAATNPATAAIVGLRKELGNTKAALLIKEGENRVLKSLVDPTKFAAEGTGGDAGGPQPTAEEVRMQDLEAERVRIAEEVDAGRMTMREYAEQTNKINKEERELTLAAAQAIADSSAQPTNDLALQQQTTEIIAKYPVLSKLTVAQLTPLKDLAYQQAELEGKTIEPGPQGTLQLRERMGALAQQFYGKSAAAPAGGTSSTGATVTSLPTAGEREQKLTLAGTHPPDIGKTGSGATGGEPSDAQAAAALGGDEDAAIRWMLANPGYVQKQMGNSTRLR